MSAVVAGAAEPHSPQPYAVMDIDSLLWHISSPQMWYHVGALTFDRAGGLLYLIEPMVDAEKPIVHVWKLERPTAV